MTNNTAPESIADLTAEKLAAANVQRDIVAIVTALRDAADAVEGISARTVSGASRTAYADIAHDVQRAIDFALANAPLRRLPQAAAEADVFRALGQ